mmetsp:Transcript_9956/g.17901  ORF Transcript_9956/g.17901 Transcript_9956/m.17901 type:complete len:133 (+) Transcript_9956:71-469(+)
MLPLLRQATMQQRHAAFRGWMPAVARSCRTMPQRSQPTSQPEVPAEAELRRRDLPGVGPVRSVDNIVEADMRVVLVGGALLCLSGSMIAVYIAFTKSPNDREQRVWFKRGEYIAGATVAGALGILYVITRKG